MKVVYGETMNFHPAIPSHTEQDENPNQPNQPELITERLTLRHLREADIPDIVESCRDPQMIRYTRVPLNYTRADAEDSLLTTARQIAAGQIQRWAIDASGVFAGSIELRLPDGTPESPGTRAELGYYTAPKARGKGYMTEALRAVLGTPSTRSDWVSRPCAGPPWRVTNPPKRWRSRPVSPASTTILTRTPAAPTRTATRCNTGYAAPI